MRGTASEAFDDDRGYRYEANNGYRYQQIFDNVCLGNVVGGANVMVIDVDIIAINEKFGGACFALVIVGSCFFYLNASTMWAFNYFDSFAHVCFPIL